MKKEQLFMNDPEKFIYFSETLFPPLVIFRKSVFLMRFSSPLLQHDWQFSFYSLTIHALPLGSVKSFRSDSLQVMQVDMLINPLESLFLIAEIEDAIRKSVVEVAYTVDYGNRRLMDRWTYVPVFLRPLVDSLKQHDFALHQG